MLSANQSFQRENILSSQRIVDNNQPQNYNNQQSGEANNNKALEILDGNQRKQSDLIESIPIDQNSNQQKIPVYKKKKTLIIAGILVAILLASAGIAGYVLYNQLQEKSDSPQIPVTFPKYKEQIMAGQEQNLLKIIHVPKTLRVYEYTLYNLQKTQQSQELENESFSKTTHKLGLVCTNVTESSFDMMLYVMESTFIDNTTNKNSTLSGYPSLKENRPQRRFLKGEIESVTQEESNIDSSIFREFEPLSQNEVEILKAKNITEEQYYFSYLPIIRFTMSKNGLINYVQQPINLRYDLHSVFLNILEQISPVVLKDFYSIVQQEPTKNGNKRVLQFAKQQYSQRMLNNQESQPNLEAQVATDVNGNLQKSFSQTNNKENYAVENTSYTQNTTIINGALKSSQVESIFSMSDNSNNQEHQAPLMKNIGMNSNCTITFMYQNDEMDSNLYDQLKEDQENMAVLELTWNEAIDIYNKVFNQSYQTHTKSKQNEQKRALEGQDGKAMKTVLKPIFRQNYASIDFGADVKSECVEAAIISGDDICTVGLYSYFNGNSMLVAEKQTKINISQVLKYYQYIQYILSDKIVTVKGKLQNHIETISNQLNDIMTRVDIMLDIQQNPVLKDIYNVVYKDELKIISQINQIELFINTAIKNVNKIAEDPLTTLKSRILNFLLKKQIDIREQVENIEKFYKGQFKRILDYIISVKNNGVSDKVYQKLKSALEHYDGVIIELVEIPVKKMLDAVEASILEQADQAYKNSMQVDQQVSVDSKSAVAQNKTDISAPLKLKQILTTANLTDTLSTIVSKSVKQIFNQTQVHDALMKGLKQSLDLQKTDVIKQLDGLKRNNTVEANQEVDEIIQDIESVVDYSINLYHDVKEVKDDIVEIVNALKKLQGYDTKKLILDLTSNLIDFPVNLAVQIKDSAVVTVQKIKQIGSNMKTNLLQWKDDLVKNSTSLVTEVKTLYKDVIDFLQIKQLPSSDDPKFYSKPLFDDISQLTNGVKDLMNVKFQNLTNTYNRFVEIPNKFKKFISDFQALGKRTVDFYTEIKVAITSVKIEGGLLWQYIQNKTAEAKSASFSSIQNVINSDLVEQVQSQAISPLSDSSSSIMKTDMIAYQQQVDFQQTNMTQIYKEVIKTIIANSEFDKKSITFEPFSFPLEYVYFYPTPIGVAIKLKLSASWNAGFNLNLSFKNATLDLSAGVNTKVSVLGEVSASIVIAEVGGYAEGTFLETSVTTGIQLQVLNSFHGNFYIDGSFKPYSVKIGIYYMYYFPSEITKCGSIPQPTQDEIKGQIEVKKNVQTINQSIISSIFNKIKKAIDCLTQIKLAPQKKDIFPPIQVQGQIYQKRLFEESF
ncbi:transmembrane protein, putative (macronuclear) [Tetrahymena thermophila SB210]|uniref:Transmembrane protein, putative n=1 Tax=Tetrahymena thermophila (strain SB210) TaxID=312017 RepID=I7M0Y1_TETTS|nr:transmembrane protein, putative [Tetrahymena thermophila SB210]EAR92922.1 transmembrane protein, putative [Tetrahymena thermophila SB210]|eukprot:XP_001013167.1 transmembrane protein, putative [Tetrahymena thermophila SB210]